MNSSSFYKGSQRQDSRTCPNPGIAEPNLHVQAKGVPYKRFNRYVRQCLELHREATSADREIQVIPMVVIVVG